MNSDDFNIFQVIPQHPGLLQFCKLVVSLARDLLKVELPPFHFWLRAVHKKLIALKDYVLLHEKIQEETRNDDRIEQQRRKKDTLHLTEIRKMFQDHQGRFDC